MAIDKTKTYSEVEVDGELLTLAGGSGELTATTDAEMVALLTQENLGRVVKFTGTSDTYETDTYYLIGE